MTLPATGLVVDRQPDILARMIEAQKTLIDVNINADPSTLLGQLTSIVSVEVARVTALAQDIYDSRSIDVATDIALDDLVSILGVTRQAAQPSSGEQYIRCTTLNQVIPARSQVVSPSNGAVYAFDTSVSVSPLACREVNIEVLTTTVLVSYEVTVNGDIYTYTSLSPTASATILAALNTAINTAAPTAYSSSITDGRLKIVTSAYTDLAITIDSKLRFYDITVAGDVTGVANGAVIQAPSTVTAIRSPTSGWVQTYNPQSYSEGRVEETDAELRIRALISTSSGNATVDAIRAAVLAVTGVTACDVIEQYYSDGVDPITGQVPCSIQCVVAGGADVDVAQAIWDTKAAGIETFGTTTNSAVIDSVGGTQTVKFSRATTVPIYVSVTFDLYNEGDFPSPTTVGITAIEDAILAYGATLVTGEDVLYQRFFGAVYGAVSGISNVVVEISDVNLAGVAASDIVINANEVAIFARGATTLSVTINP